MSFISVPYVFVPGTYARASEVNANFSTIVDKINGNLTAANIALNSITNDSLAWGIDAEKIGDGSVNNTRFGYLANVTSDIQAQIDSKSDIGHTHSASDITSGTLAAQRGGTGIGSYTTGNYIRASGATTLEQRTPSQVRSDIGADNADNITSGTLAVERGGTGIGSYTTGNYIRASGTTSLEQRTPDQVRADIGANNASNITSGVLAVARGGTGIGSYTSGNYIRASGATSLEQRTPAQVRSDIGAAASSHTHSADDITSGVLPAARGGTGIGSYNTGFYIRAGGPSLLQQISPNDVKTNIGAFSIAPSTSSTAEINMGANSSQTLSSGVYYIVRLSGTAWVDISVGSDWLNITKLDGQPNNGILVASALTANGKVRIYTTNSAFTGYRLTLV